VRFGVPRAHDAPSHVISDTEEILSDREALLPGGIGFWTDPSEDGAICQGRHCRLEVSHEDPG